LTMSKLRHDEHHELQPTVTLHHYVTYARTNELVDHNYYVTTLNIPVTHSRLVFFANYQLNSSSSITATRPRTSTPFSLLSVNESVSHRKQDSICLSIITGKLPDELCLLKSLYSLFYHVNLASLFACFTQHESLIKLVRLLSTAFNLASATIIINQM